MKDLRHEIKKIYEQYQTGTPVVQIAKVYNCSRQAIYSNLQKYCRENNLPLTQHKKGKKSPSLPMKEIYDRNQKGEATIKIAQSYNCSVKTLLKLLHIYCKENHLPFKKNVSRPSKIGIPTSEIYQMHQSGSSLQEIADLCHCHYQTIYKKISQYCEKNNLPRKKRKSKFDTPSLMEEIYAKHQSGDSLKTLAKFYHCHTITLSTNLHRYCEENNLPFKGHNPQFIDLPLSTIYNLYQSGKTIKEISRIYQCSYGLIYNRLHQYAKENNLCLNPPTFKIVEKLLPEEEIYNLYQSGKTMKEIAETYQCSYKTISAHLKKYSKEKGLPLRKPQRKQPIKKEDKSDLIYYKRAELYIQLRELLQISKEVNLESHDTIYNGLIKQKTIGTLKQKSDK